MSGNPYNPVPEGAGTRAHSGYASRLEIKLDETLKELIIRHNGQPSNTPVYTESWGAWMQTMHEDTLAVTISQKYKDAHGIGSTLSESDDINASKFIPSVANVARMPLPANIVSLIANTNSTKEDIINSQKNYIRKQLSLVGVVGRAYYTGRVDGNNTSATTGSFADYVCYKTLTLPVNRELRPFEPLELDVFVGDGADGRVTVRNISPDSIADAMKRNVQSYSALYAKDDGLTFRNIYERGGGGSLFESNTTPIFGEDEEIGQKFLVGGLAFVTRVMGILESATVISNGKNAKVLDKKSGKMGATKGDKLPKITAFKEAIETLDDIFVNGSKSDFAPSFLKMLVDTKATSIPAVDFDLASFDGISLLAQATAEEMCFHRPIGMMTNILDSGTQSGPYQRYDFVISAV